MKITISQYAGFCNGVKRAYEMVNSLDMKSAKKPIYILGTLVHNADVNKKIEKLGIKEIERADFFAAKAGEIGTLIITAHGTGPAVYAKAREIDAEILDTTCPKVVKVQRLAQVYAKREYGLIIIGDKEHKEVRGINDWAGGKAQIVSGLEDIKKINFPTSAKIAVLSQTTQNEDFFEEASKIIQKKFPQAEIVSTICRTTEERQKEIKKLAEMNDLVLVIGSKTSANSNRLFEIAKSINQKTYFIENASEINPEWFKNIETCAITAGASTPSWVIEEVMKRISI
jgi:(E)-4-hydroxy-3-methyl-but-2-enyl pyrophosphate reductase